MVSSVLCVLDSCDMQVSLFGCLEFVTSQVYIYIDKVPQTGNTALPFVP